MEICDKVDNSDEEQVYFSLEELFADEKRRKPNESVEVGFKRSDSLNPLLRLIREEEKRHLRSHAGVLQNFLFKNLELQDYAFLSGVLGKNWVYRLRLPLEFKELSKGEFKTYLSRNRDEFLEKIEILREHIAGTTLTNQDAAIQEVIGVPYGLATRGKIIGIYEMIQTGMFKRYPKGFMHPENHRVPKILTRHLVDDLLSMPRSEKTVESLKPEHFRDYGLAFILEQHYGGNPRQALQRSYSSREFPAAHTKKYDDSEILREVFLRLDSKNGKVPHE